MNNLFWLCLWIFMAYAEQIAAACLYGVAACAWGIAAAGVGMVILVISR